MLYSASSMLNLQAHFLWTGQIDVPCVHPQVNPTTGNLGLGFHLKRVKGNLNDTNFYELSYFVAIMHLPHHPLRHMTHRLDIAFFVEPLPIAHVHVDSANY